MTIIKSAATYNNSLLTVTVLALLEILFVEDEVPVEVVAFPVRVEEAFWVAIAAGLVFAPVTAAIGFVCGRGPTDPVAGGGFALKLLAAEL